MLSDIQVSDHLEAYGRQCSFYSNCNFSFACTSLDGNHHGPVKKICLEKDRIIFRNQLETESIYVILSGIMTAFFYLPTGEPVVVGNMGKGQTIGDLEAFNSKKSPYNVKTLASVTLCRLPLIYLTQFVKLTPSLMSFFFAASEIGSVLSMTRQIWVMNAQRIYDRLGRLLITLSDLGLEKVDDITSIPVSHEDLGFLINADRTSITRTLNKLEKEGLVTLDYNRINVTDSLISRFSEQGSMSMVA